LHTPALDYYDSKQINLLIELTFVINLLINDSKQDRALRREITAFCNIRNLCLKKAGSMLHWD